jgi:S1-C subfamily serine protease
MASIKKIELPSGYDRSNEEWWVKTCMIYRASILSVQCGRSLGTGWILGVGEGKFGIVTARHVITSALCEKDMDDLVFRSASVDGWELAVKRVNCLILESSTIDVAIILIEGVAPGPELPVVYPPNPSNKVDIVDIGVPPLGIEVGWVGFAEGPMNMFDEPTVTFCRGRICAVGAEKPEKKKHLFLLDGNVNCGMSGGPVWASTGAVLGIVTALHTPTCGSIYGVIVPMGYILQMFRKAGGGVKNF